MCVKARQNDNEVASYFINFIMLLGLISGGDISASFDITVVYSSFSIVCTCWYRYNRREDDFTKGGCLAW